MSGRESVGVVESRDGAIVTTATTEDSCVFCRIIAGEAPGAGGAVIEYEGATVFRPLNPVTRNHMLVVPNVHIAHAGDDPQIAGRAFEAAATYAREHFESFNIITSANEAATQSIYHLHFHVIPRRFGDGLALPWSVPSTSHDEQDAYTRGYRAHLAYLRTLTPLMLTAYLKAEGILTGGHADD